MSFRKNDARENEYGSNSHMENNREMPNDAQRMQNELMAQYHAENKSRLEEFNRNNLPNMERQGNQKRSSSQSKSSSNRSIAKATTSRNKSTTSTSKSSTNSSNSRRSSKREDESMMESERENTRQSRTSHSSGLTAQDLLEISNSLKNRMRKHTEDNQMMHHDNANHISEQRHTRREESLDMENNMMSDNRKNGKIGFRINNKDTKESNKKK